MSLCSRVWIAAGHAISCCATSGIQSAFQRGWDSWSHLSATETHRSEREPQDEGHSLGFEFWFLLDALGVMSACVFLHILFLLPGHVCETPRSHDSYYFLSIDGSSYFIIYTCLYHVYIKYSYTFSTVKLQSFILVLPENSCTIGRGCEVNAHPEDATAFLQLVGIYTQLGEASTSEANDKANQLLMKQKLRDPDSLNGGYASPNLSKSDVIDFQVAVWYACNKITYIYIYLFIFIYVYISLDVQRILDPKNGS